MPAMYDTSASFGQQEYSFGGQWVDPVDAERRREQEALGQIIAAVIGVAAVIGFVALVGRALK